MIKNRGLDVNKVEIIFNWFDVKFLFNRYFMLGGDKLVYLDFFFWKV